jgi:SNF2 family DNA or RNA helicase
LKGVFVNEKMQAVLVFRKKEGRIDVTVQFHYGEYIFSSNPEETVLPEDEFLSRDIEQESEIEAALVAKGFKKTEEGFSRSTLTDAGIIQFFRYDLPFFREKAKVMLGKKLSQLFIDDQKMKPTVSVKEVEGWLDVQFDFEGIDESEVDDLILSLIQGRTYYPMKNGAVMNLETENFMETSTTLKLIRQKMKPVNGHFHLQKVQGLAISQALEPIADVDFSEDFKSLVSDLNDVDRSSYQVPEELNASLRSYQLDGVKWLDLHSKHGLGGILADEMGLGKTLQFLAYLQLERMKNWKGVALLVAPASLLYNWESECKRFTPNLRVQVVTGTKHERTEQIQNREVDLLITSYQSFRNDVNFYTALQLGYLVLDEAQMVKNDKSKTSSALRKLKPQQTFALTGTPVENRVEELWSLFSIVLPGLFPNRSTLKTMANDQLHRLSSPFILRRKKSEVLKDLPEKTEEVLYSTLTTEQKKIYLKLLKEMNNDLSLMDDGELKRNKLTILAGLTRLRQVCDDPSLFVEGYNGGSGKKEQLLELVQVAKENGRRILLFSQFTSMLEILSTALEEVGLSHFYLSGQTKVKDRLEMVNAFNNGEKDLFLISLKAGGTGLNLTGADTVILYDLWWNPAVEEQAAGRAHRIGQKKNVEVWRMVSKGTIEERILQLQEGKRALFDEVIEGEGTNYTLTESELRMILSMGEEL